MSVHAHPFDLIPRIFIDCLFCYAISGMGGACAEIEYFPNATVAEYGMIEDDDDAVAKIMSEIYVRGPVAATINAEPIVKYTGGVFTDESHSQGTNHIVSIIGWGKDPESGKQYWIIRNSWGKWFVSDILWAWKHLDCSH
jgi:cathepsin X